MKEWFKRTRRTIGMAVMWGVLWAPAAVAIGIIADPDGSMDEMWPAIGAYPGFLAGLLFVALLSLAGLSQRLPEVSLPRIAGLGAIAGLLPSVFPVAIADFAFGTSAMVVLGPMALVSAVSATASVLAVRYASRRDVPVLRNGLNDQELTTGR